MTLTVFPSIITDKGIMALENYTEDYQRNSFLSPEKLSRFQTLMFTYYMQTGNIIHKDIFDEVERKLQNLSDGGSPFVSKSIKFLFESGCLDKNPKYVYKGEKQ